MKLDEFFKKYNVTEIKEQWSTIGYNNLDSIIGMQVWICDYRINDPQNKPIRAISPRLVTICSNNDLPKNKRVYYSPIHFRELKNSGTGLKSTIIAPFDNTGYRSLTGVSLNIFEDQDACCQYFVKQCNEAISKLDNYKKSINEYINNQIHSIKSLK